MCLIRICILLLFVFIFQPFAFSSNLRIILLTSDKGLLESHDSGITWNDFNKGLPEKFLPVKLYAGNSGQFYLITKNSGIYELENDNRWTDINSEYFLEPSFISDKRRFRKISAFSVSCDKKNTLLLATKHSIYKRNAINSWMELKKYSGEKYYTALARQPDERVFAGTSCNGFYRISKSGLVSLSMGLPGEFYSKKRRFYEEITEIEFDSKDPKTIYAGLNFGKGVFISKNLGQSWESLGMPIAKDSLCDIYDIKSYNNSLFVSAGPGIFRMDGNRKWHSLSFVKITGLASEAGNLAVMIIDKSGEIPPLFFRFNRQSVHENFDLTPGRIEKKAIYANAYSLKKNLSSYIETIKACGFNAIVIDMKDDWGDICYSSNNRIANEINSVKSYIDAGDVLEALTKENIYAIARIVVFKDKRLYMANNSKYAIWDKKENKPWKGNTKEYWNDPYSEFVQDYNIAIANELQELGFNEIQFDYIRFPSDGPLWRCLYRYKKNDNIYKSEILAAFLNKAKEKLNIPVSLDIYGFNTWFRFGNIIGQDIERFSEIIDIICPMIYPSHYGKSFFLDYPVSEKPYRIVLENSRRAVKIIGIKAVIRPYIQGFNLLSPTWGPDYILDQIKAVYEGGCDGYTFWNAGGNYDMVKKALLGKKDMSSDGGQKK